jgi:hypothetical protein
VFWRRGQAVEMRNCGEKGDLGRQPGQKGGNGPNRRSLPRPRKRLHSALARTKHRVHSATRQRQRQRKAKANSICQGAPRQPASRASSGWKQSRRFGSRSQEVRQKEDAQSGRAGVGHWRCLSAPHVASPERSRSGPTVPAHPAPRTGFGYGVPDVPTHGPGDVRRWGWHRVLRAHVSAVY